MKLRLKIMPKNINLFLRRSFEIYEDYSNIKLPVKFTFSKNKNKIKSNISKNQFKNYVKKAKKIHF